MAVARRRAAFALALVLPLGACVHSRQVPMTGCDHPSGWSSQIRAMALETYAYAQMSANSYGFERDGSDSFEPFARLPGWRKLKSFPNNLHDMAYDVWRRDGIDGQRSELVLAFRGTEPNRPGDYKASITMQQNRDGLAAFDEWKKQADGARMIVTGHSLGGAIATQISLSRPDVDSYVFNSSPRFKAPRQPFENKRVSVAEYGEFLKTARIFGREPKQDYFSLNCTRGSLANQHGSAQLASCLTQIAWWSDPSLETVLADNKIPIPANRAGRPDCRRVRQR